MKVLAVGSVPPPPVGYRLALLAEVIRLRGEGHDVEIASLDPLSAAHRYLVAPGVSAAVEIGLLARRADAVVLQVEPGLPVRPAAGRTERAASLLALATSLRSVRNVTVRLQHPDDLPGGLGGRAAMALWKVADRIEVGDEATRTELVGTLGPGADRVTLMASPDPLGLEVGSGHEAVASGGYGDGADMTAAQVQAVVRARAAAERQALAARGRLPLAGDAAPRVPQWQWLPAPGAGVPDLGLVRAVGGGRHTPGSARPGGAPSSSFFFRRAATSLLAAAERRPLTRPAAHLARLAYVELRGAVRH